MSCSWKLWNGSRCLQVLWEVVTRVTELTRSSVLVGYRDEDEGRITDG